MRVYCLFFLFCLVLPLELPGQTALRFARIGEKEGLKSPIVYAITQDREGFMWFGSKNGLHRFDTKNIRTFLPDSVRPKSLKDERVRSLLIDSKNRFWVGTAKGIQLFDRISETFTDFQPDPKNPIQSEILSIYEDRKGNLWFGTSENLHFWDEKNKTYYAYQSLKDSIIKNFEETNYLSGFILQDRRGKYWCATWLDHYGLVDINPSKADVSLPPTMKPYNYFDPSPYLTTNSAELIDKMYEDSRGRIWFAAFLGLYRYDYQHNEYIWFRVEANRKGGLTSRVRDIIEDRDGNIWIGAYGGGLCRFEPKTQTFVTYTHEPKNQSSISSNYIRCLFRDRDGTIWIGTENGVSILDPLDNQFETISPTLKQNQDATIGNTFLEEDQQGFLWSRGIKGKDFAGPMHYGIWGYQPMTHEFIKANFPRRSSFLRRLSASTFLVQSVENSLIKQHFLYIWDTRQQTTKPYRPSTKIQPWMNPIFWFFENDSTAWLGGYHIGIFRLTPRSLNLYTQSQKEGLKYNFFHSRTLKDSEGRVWISASSDRLYYFDPTIPPQINKNLRLLEQEKIQRDSMVAKQDLAAPILYDSLITNQLISILLKKEADNRHYTTGLIEYQNEIIVATSDIGLVVIDKKTKKIKTTYTQKNGLVENSIYGIVADKQGFLWLSHPKGITKWDRKNDHFEHYFVQTDLPTVGMKEQGTGSGTAYCSPFSGKIYFGTDEGLIAFQPEKLKQNRLKPDVFISRFKAFGKEYTFDTAISFKKEIVLKHDENFISFEMSALNYSNYWSNQYAYKMENFDQDWVVLGTKNEAIYTNLPAGEYIFRFRASNDKGVWNDKGNSIRVIVLPPWWATWWFRLLAISLILGSAWAFYKNRINRLEKQKHILETTVQARTLEIEQQKTTISVAFAQNKAVTDALDSSAIVSIADLQGRIVKANAIFSQISGYSIEELAGQDHRIVNSGYHPKSFWVEMWKTIVRGETWRAEVCNRAKNGDLYWVDTVINPIYDEKGKIYQYLSIRTLVTERKNAEKELNKTLEIVSQQRDDIISSINYALRIQTAIIPKETELQKHFDCFVFFRPKDIVSGDFYWFAEKVASDQGRVMSNSEEITNHSTLSTKILAVADCTGHGVSGAFMTMIGNNILNQIVHDYEIHEPDEILNLMPILLEKTLSHSEGTLQDGMDISIVAMAGGGVISYAGAMNPLYYVQNQEFKELKADKVPIGGKSNDEFSYQKHEILSDQGQVMSNSQGFTHHSTLNTPHCTLYLCSDGFQDQFGGEKNRKFMVKKLKNLLFEMSEKPMAEQKQILEQTLEQWKGTREQTDDVLVVGIRV